MSLDEIREKHAAGNETAAEAFHELCSMVEAIEVTLFIFVEIFEYIKFLHSCRLIRFVFVFYYHSVSEKNAEKRFKQKSPPFEQ